MRALLWIGTSLTIGLFLGLLVGHSSLSPRDSSLWWSLKQGCFPAVTTRLSEGERSYVESGSSGCAGPALSREAAAAVAPAAGGEAPSGSAPPDATPAPASVSPSAGRTPADADVTGSVSEAPPTQQAPVPATSQPAQTAASGDTRQFGPPSPAPDAAARRASGPGLGPAPFRVSEADLRQAETRPASNLSPPSSGIPAGPAQAMLPREPDRTGGIGEGRAGAAPPRPALAFSCRQTEGAPAPGGPSDVRVRVEPGEKAILVEGRGVAREAGAGSARYTLDQNYVAWFGGRHERDPRLSVVLSPTQGSMWLDVAEERNSSGPGVRPQRYRCQTEGAPTASAR